MGKLDNLLKAGGANIAESMGAGLDRAVPAGPTTTTPARWQGVSKSKNAVEVLVDKIVPDPDQPREDFDAEALQRLAASFKARGQLQPVRVRWDVARQAYVLICGERRWRAARLAGMTTLSCVVSDEPIDAGELLALQLIENCLREDLKPIEQAKAFKSLMDRNSWSGNQTAKALGIAQPTVARALALLELPEPVRDRVEQGAIAAATAYEIGKVGDPEIQQALADRVVEERMSRAEAIEAVRASSKRSRDGGKMRGALRGKKAPVRRTLKAVGCKITVENRKGVDDSLLTSALREALEQFEARGRGAA